MLPEKGEVIEYNCKVVLSPAEENSYRRGEGLMGALLKTRFGGEKPLLRPAPYCAVRT